MIAQANNLYLLQVQLFFHASTYHRRVCKSCQILYDIAELTGRAVDVGDCSRPVSWRVDNKYYSAEVHFVACRPESKQLGEGQWEAIVLLTSLDKVT